MAKAYDRVKNASNSSDVFIKTAYWTPEVEQHFESWSQEELGQEPMVTVEGYLGAGVAVSFKMIDGSVCCTLAHQASRDAGKPYLITGWSDNATDALAVCEYKLLVMLSGVWDAPEAPKPTRRH